jgi:hypothetical protein
MNTQSARDYLAFMKALVEGDGGAAATRTFGQAYFAAGAIYGAQTLYHWAEGQRLIAPPPLLSLSVAIGATVLFLAVLLAVNWRNRAPSLGGPTTRAVQTAFAAIGIANIVLVASIGCVAAQQQSLLIWLIYPIVVFVLQGAGWMFSFMMLRRLWHGAVAAGFFATALGLAASLAFGSSAFALIAAANLIVCMALPGYVMMRTPKAA